MNDSSSGVSESDERLILKRPANMGASVLEKVNSVGCAFLCVDG
jgi:hypothetical protein